MYDSEQVWQRIVRLTGSDFRQVGGKPFTYSVRGPRTLTLDTTNRSISRTAVEHALARWPVSGPGRLNGLTAPSYLYGILADPRVLER